MSGYPRVIFTRGVSVTVTSASDEAFWRGESTASAPETLAVTPTLEPVQVPELVEAPMVAKATHRKPLMKPAKKPVAAKGSKKK